MGRLWVEASQRSQCREATVKESRCRGVEALPVPCLYVREHCPHRHPGIEASRAGYGVDASRIGIPSCLGARIVQKGSDFKSSTTCDLFCSDLNQNSSNLSKLVQI